MAWEKRKDKAYYYETERVDDRVRKKYYGRGLSAMAQSLIAMREQKRKREERQQVLEFEEAVELGDEWVQLIENSCNTMMTATLVAAGLHQEKGREWRQPHGR